MSNAAHIVPTCEAELPRQSLLARLTGSLHRWRKRERETALLAALDDRMLRDIGLAREEIGEAVRRGHA